MVSVNHLGHPIDEVHQPYVPKTLEELLDRFLPARQQTIAVRGGPGELILDALSDAVQANQGIWV